MVSRELERTGIMNEQTLLIACIAVTSVAVVLQTAILFGMYLSTRKLSQRLTELSVKVETDVLPLAAKVRALVDENAPKVETVLANLAQTSDLVREQAVKIDAALTEVVTVARTQAANAGELAERTMQRVDHAAGTVHNAVTAPLRQLSALVEGLVAGVTEFAGIRRVRRSTKAVPTDEMFI